MATQNAAPVKFRPQVARMDKEMELKMSRLQDGEERSYVDSGLGTMSKSMASDCEPGMEGQTVLQEVDVATEHEAASVEEPEDADPEPVVDITRGVDDLQMTGLLPMPKNTIFSSVLQRALEDPSALRPTEPAECGAPEVDRSSVAVADGPFEENTHLHNYACCGDSTYLLAPFRGVLSEQNDDGDS